MDFVIADALGKDIAPLEKYKSLKINCGGKNDFQLIISKKETKRRGIEKGRYFYCHGKEYGGFFTKRESQTESEMIEWGGIVFRGMLEKDYIRPPAGQDRRVISGDGNDIIRTILAEDGAIGTFFTVPQTPAGVIFSNYTFPRYVTKLQGLNRMLRSEGYRLKIHADQRRSGDSFVVIVEAVPIVDYADKIEYSQDSQVNIHVTDNDAQINHLICLGAGELKDRLVVDLYLQSDGSISQAKYYSGIDELIGRFSNTSAKTLDDLVETGEKHFKKYLAGVGVQLNTSDFDFEIGDIIGGRDYDTGVNVKNPITEKNIRSDGIEILVEVDVKGDADDDEEEE